MSSNAWSSDWPKAGPDSPLLSAGGRANFGAVSASPFTPWAANNDFRLWSAGLSAAPDYWRLTGSGAGVVLTGIGQADTTKGLFSGYCAKVTAGGAQAIFEQRLIPPGSVAPFGDLVGTRVSFGCGLNPTAILSARISITDGVSETEADLNAATGDQWHTHSKIVESGFSELTCRIKVNASQVCYVWGPTPWPGPVMPARPYLCPWVFRELTWPFAGELSVLDGALGAYLAPNLPSLVVGVDSHLETLPTGASVLYNVYKNTTANEVLLSDGVHAVAGSQWEEQAADATIDKRSLGRSDRLAMRITQIGSTTPGSDLNVFARLYTPQRPQQMWLAHAAVD